MKYIFLHIPKTAGTSMRQALMHGFPEAQTASCYRIGKVEDDLASAIESGKSLIVGHIDFSHLQQVKLPNEYRLMAMFRNPADRIISTYLHFQKHKDPRYSTWKGGEVNFEDFMQTEFANNWMCQLLSGKKGLTAPASQDEQIYQEAKINLHKLDWVGISERFDDSLFSLSQYLGRNLKNSGRYNEGGDIQKHRELKRKYSEEINKLNSYDLILYETAKNMLNHQLKSVGNKRIKQLWFNLRSRI